MQQYELTVLYHPDLEIDLDKPKAKVEKIIKDAGGKIAKEDNWGKRKLAYEIRHQEYAVYVIYDLELPADGVKKINDALNITDEVVRFLIVKQDLKAKAKADALKAKQAARRGNRDESADAADEKVSEEE